MRLGCDPRTTGGAACRGEATEPIGGVTHYETWQVFRWTQEF